jgi:hypothetical protein
MYSALPLPINGHHQTDPLGPVGTKNVNRRPWTHLYVGNQFG